MGLILMICLTGFIAAFSILFTTQGLFDRFATEQKSSHIIRILNTKNADIEGIKEYLGQDDRIESYHLQFCTGTLGRVQINEYDDIMTIIEEMPVEPKHDLIKIIDGKESDVPGLNETWIASGLAYKYQVKVGDTLQVTGVDGKENYLISAIIFDPLFASSLVSPSRMWVRSGQLSMVKGLSEVNQRALSIRLKEVKQSKEVLADFDEAFPKLTYSLSVEYATFKMMGNILNNVISSVLLGASLLLCIISAAILFFIVSGEIVNDYTVFGIYKGLGFSMSQIKNINRFKFTWIVLLVMPLSIISAFSISRLVLSIYEKMTGVVYLQPKLILPSMISILVMLLIILGTIQVASRKLSHLKPAEAIRFGYQSQKNYRKTHRLSKLNVVATLGLKEANLYPLRSGVKILTITSLAILFFTTNIISSSLGNIFTSELIIGIPDGDIYIQKNESLAGRSVENILKDLESMEGVENVIPAIMSFDNAVISEGEYISLMGFGYDDYTGKRNLGVMEGRNPTNDNEVAITQSLAKKINKSIGDMITLNIEGNLQTFLISGTFQIASHMGMAFRITADAYQQASPESEYKWFSLSAGENEDLEVLKTKMIAKFGSELTITIFEDFVQETVGSITKSLQLLGVVLMIITAFICGMALYNMIWIQMIENKKYYGLMKAVGMSKGQLARMQLFQITILTAISVVLGLFVTIFGVPVILSNMLAASGISQVEGVLSPVWIMIVTIAIFAITLSSTYVAAMNQSKVNLKSLIME